MTKDSTQTAEGQWKANKGQASPEPWSIQGTLIKSANGVTIAAIYGQPALPEIASNARLIIAAPALLGACKRGITAVRVLENLLEHHGFHTGVEVAKALEADMAEAIAKTEGRK